MTPFVLAKTPTEILFHYQYCSGQRDLDLHRRASRSDRPTNYLQRRRALTTTVDNVEHIESTSYDGVGVIKVFHPTVNPSAGAKLEDGILKGAGEIALPAMVRLLHLHC